MLLLHKPLIAYLCWTLIISPKIATAETEHPKSFVSIQLENDAFSLIADHGDHYYTHGTLLSFLKVKEPPSFLQMVAQWSPFSQNGNSLNLVQYTLGHKVFTPNDTVSSVVVSNDRPYAGYLYYGISTLSHSRLSENVDSGNLIEVNFGLVGPSALGEQTQTLLHNILDLSSPNGWNNQLKDELTFNISYSRLFRRIKPISDELMLGINHHETLTLGNAYTYLASGVMFRVGDNLRRDLSPPTISPGFPGLPYFQAINDSSWYLYLGFEGRIVIRDIFLDGNTFANSHSVEKELFVMDTQLGFTYMFNDIRIAVSKMYRTNEFILQKERDVFGEINLSFQY